MSGPPLFVHAGWRTGGTALGFALGEQDGVMVFHDPLNPGLSLPWSSTQGTSPTSWASGHPTRARGYFGEYEPLVEGDRVAGAKERFWLSYSMSEHAQDPEQAAYIGSLLELAKKSGKTAVIKFEQTDGRIPWLRAHFPEAEHVGLVRDGDAQLASWLVQLVVHDNAVFFSSAHSVAKRTPELFGEVPADLDVADFAEVVALFWRFHGTTERLRRAHCDVVLDIAPESGELPADQARRMSAALDARTVGILGRALDECRRFRPPADRRAWTLERLHGASMIAPRLRGEATVLARLLDDCSSDVTRLGCELAACEADGRNAMAAREVADLRVAQLIADRDAYAAELRTLKNSRSWRWTSFFRRTRGTGPG